MTLGQDPRSSTGVKAKEVADAVRGSSWRTITLLLVGLGVFVTEARATGCPTFDSGISVGSVSYGAVNEASGLASSRGNPGLLWVHNDSGNSAILFVLDAVGNLVRRYVPTGVANWDWEALGIGPGPRAGQTYLYIGDIGDNSVSRDFITVYRVPEPSVKPGKGKPALGISGSVALQMQYPDGVHDAEALFVDPENSDIYIVTKNFGTGVSGIYRYPAPHDESSTVVLEKIKSITLPGNAIERAVTGADISPDGREIIIRSYTRAYHWKRAKGSSVQSAFSEDPCEVPIGPEPQGETVSFTWDGKNYVTLSETAKQPIFLYRRAP